MIFSLAIYSAPFSYEGTHTAYRFAQAAIAEGHKIHRVFFYHDGVYNASQLHCPPQDEIDISELWAKFAKVSDIELVVCVASALKRGLLNEQEAERYEKKQFNLADEYQLGGLGQLIEAMTTSDRFITFKS